MQLCLLDTNSNRRLVWRRTCQKYSIELRCFEALSAFVSESSPHSRLLVFDQSVVGDCMHSAASLVARFREDVVAVVLPTPNCSKAMRMIEAGISWLFDEGLPQLELDDELPRLMKLVEEHDIKLQRFRSLQNMFNAISSGERDVMTLILDGKHNNQIAAELGISIRTVESRRANAYRKCNTTSLAELARRSSEFEKLLKIFKPDATDSTPTPSKLATIT